MKTVLITGGAGFIGSNLCQRLCREHHKVICVDNFYTGRRQNIELLRRQPNFTLLEHDITEELKIDGPVDEIYNLACPASPPAYQRSPVTTIKTNVIGMLNMLELANKKNARILQASTSEVYGDPLEHPQKETYWGNVNPVGIRACYDEGKRCAEALCFDHYRELGTRIKVIRIFNTYGPNMDPEDGRVVSNFIFQALQNQPVTIYGDGSQTRSFCYVDDLIQGMIAVMESNDEFQGPVNLGNPEEYTILNLARKIIFLTGSRSNIIFLPLPPDDPGLRRPSIELAEKKFGWTPGVPLEKGLKKTIDCFRERATL